MAKIFSEIMKTDIETLMTENLNLQHWLLQQCYRK